MNFGTEDEMNIYSKNSEDELNDPHTPATSPEIITPEITDVLTWFIKKPGQKFEIECLLMPPTMVGRRKKNK